jgi:hypothetical protein
MKRSKNMEEIGHFRYKRQKIIIHGAEAMAQNSS